MSGRWCLFGLVAACTGDESFALTVKVSQAPPDATICLHLASDPCAAIPDLGVTFSFGSYAEAQSSAPEVGVHLGDETAREVAIPSCGAHELDSATVYLDFADTLDISLGGICYLDGREVCQYSDDDTNCVDL